MRCVPAFRCNPFNNRCNHFLFLCKPVLFLRNYFLFLCKPVLFLCSLFSIPMQTFSIPAQAGSIPVQAFFYSCATFFHSCATFFYSCAACLRFPVILMCSVKTVLGDRVNITVPGTASAYFLYAPRPGESAYHRYSEP